MARRGGREAEVRRPSCAPRCATRRRSSPRSGARRRKRRCSGRSGVRALHPGDLGTAGPRRAGERARDRARSSPRSAARWRRWRPTRTLDLVLDSAGGFIIYADRVARPHAEVAAGAQRSRAETTTTPPIPSAHRRARRDRMIDTHAGRAGRRAGRRCDRRRRDRDPTAWPGSARRCPATSRSSRTRATTPTSTRRAPRP